MEREKKREGKGAGGRVAITSDLCTRMCTDVLSLEDCAPDSPSVE